MSTQFIDFHAIKQHVGIADILNHYSLMGRLHQSGDNITGNCPIHESNRGIAFRANASLNCWNCFNQCSCGGDILDFVAKKEKVSLQKAARLIVQWFNLSLEPPETETAPARETFIPACHALNRLSDASASGGRLFIVKRYWQVCDTVQVSAASIAEAIQAAHELPLDHARAEYVPDSFASDPDTDVQPLLP